MSRFESIPDGVQPECDELSQKLCGDWVIGPGLPLDAEPWNESLYVTYPDAVRRRLFSGAACSWNLLSSVPKKLTGDWAGAELAGVITAGASWFEGEAC